MSPAKVTVANESKGIRRAMETNDAGVFNAPALVPSPGYAVTVNMDGFAPFERREMQLQVGMNLEAPLVESTKTGVSQVVNDRQITNLPINGRRVDSFVLLSPAVVADGTFGLVSVRGIAGGNAGAAPVSPRRSHRTPSRNSRFSPTAIPPNTGALPEASLTR